MRDGCSLRAAIGGLATLFVVGPNVAACSSKAGPDDDAIASYLERHGVAIADATAAANADGVSTPATAAPAAPASRIALTIERATGLPDLDAGPGVTDPYVVVDYEGQRFKTSVVEGSLEPVWGDTFILDVRTGGVLVVRMMDEDSFSSDEQIGTQSQVLPDLAIGESRMLTLTFRNGTGGTLTMTATGMARP